MTTAFTVLSLLAVAYRMRKKLVTRAEWMLLALWLGHFAIEELQLVAHMRRFYYGARFMRPAEFLLWPWGAWAMARFWRAAPVAKRIVLAVLLLAVVYDSVLLIKANLPVGRRGAYVAAANWAAEKIGRDWRGPAADGKAIFDAGEYRTALRPVVDCHTARLAYLVGGRSNGIETSEEIEHADRPDYWMQDVRREDPPGDGWELMGTYRRGKYELPLYRRIP